MREKQERREKKYEARKFLYSFIHLFFFLKVLGSHPEAIEMLEQGVRFCILLDHLLCHEPPDRYDEKLNMDLVLFVSFLWFYPFFFCSGGFFYFFLVFRFFFFFLCHEQGVRFCILLDHEPPDRYDEKLKMEFFNAFF